FETVAKSMTDMDKFLVADYLTHSTATAEKHYCMKQRGAIVRASQLLAQLAGDSVESPDEDASHGTRGARRNAANKSACTSYVPMDIQAAFDQLLKAHPVTLDGDVPDKTARKKVSPNHQRQLYERWLKAQMKLRIEHVLYFCRRLPTENRVSSWISKQGWSRNVPKAANIIREWKPSGAVDMAMDSQHIQKLTRSQKWKGLLVTEIEGKGKGVLATRRF
uniref:Si:ch211-261d9.1 n=1 Tax=Seriola dumerili TaxID=41447 RepID=A0A3B4V8Z5_SERDU